MAARLCLWIVVLGFLKVGLAADPSQLVQGLPGQPQVGFKQYAGQVTINATAGRALFYWFYEADSPNASSLPLVLWLTGGPGCSSIGAGALAEVGPFRTNDSGTGLVLNPDSWNKAANMIFLEVPYNVGFSYTTLYSDNGFYTDNTTAADSLLFLLEFLSRFPEYKQNEFFITGESYAGHFIPTLASQIVAHNQQGGQFINLKGFAVGNPSTDDKYDDPGNVQTLYTHNVVSVESYQEYTTYCSMNDEASQRRCTNASVDIFFRQTQYIDRYNILRPVCNQISSSSNQLKNLNAEKLQFPISAYDPCLDSVTPYLNLPEVQAALNVVKKPARWSLCNSDISGRSYSSDDRSRSMLPVYQELFKTGLRIWIYSGDLDSVVSTLSTRSWIKALNLTIVTPWRAWKYTNQVGGWTEIYSGLTFATVRGSGHMPPFDTPGQALVLFESFLQGKPLPSFSN